MAGGATGLERRQTGGQGRARFPRSRRKENQSVAERESGRADRPLRGALRIDGVCRDARGKRRSARGRGWGSTLPNAGWAKRCRALDERGTYARRPASGLSARDELRAGISVAAAVSAGDELASRRDALQF